MLVLSKKSAGCSLGIALYAMTITNVMGNSGLDLSSSMLRCRPENSTNPAETSTAARRQKKMAASRAEIGAKSSLMTTIVIKSVKRY